MANNNGIISPPGIGIEPDIYATLGVDRYNGLFDTVYICSNLHGKTNPDAKYKPTRALSISPATPKEWWRGSDGKCGFEFPVYTSPGSRDSGFIHDVITGAADWVYAPPKPNVDMCRFTDFNGYDHNARSPFGYFLNGSIVVNPEEQANLTSDFRYDAREGELNFSDFTIEGVAMTENMHYGAVLWNENEAFVKIDYGHNFTNGHNTPRLYDMRELCGRKFYARPIGCIFSNGSIYNITHYFATRNTTVASIEFIYVDDAYILGFNAGSPFFDRISNVIDCTGRLRNTTGATYLFSNVRMQVVYGGDKTGVWTPISGFYSLGSWPVSGDQLVSYRIPFDDIQLPEDNVNNGGSLTYPNQCYVAISADGVSTAYGAIAG